MWRRENVTDTSGHSMKKDVAASSTPDQLKKQYPTSTNITRADLPDMSPRYMEYLHITDDPSTIDIRNTKQASPESHAISADTHGEQCPDTPQP
jgi:hypothetical protein